MTDGFLGISWFVWAALAAAMAAMFTVIQLPKQTSQTAGFTTATAISSPTPTGPRMAKP
jgi:hypothetical protein